MQIFIAEVEDRVAVYARCFWILDLFVVFRFLTLYIHNTYRNIFLYLSVYTQKQYWDVLPACFNFFYPLLEQPSCKLSFLWLKEWNRVRVAFHLFGDCYASSRYSSLGSWDVTCCNIPAQWLWLFLLGIHVQSLLVFPWEKLSSGSRVSVSRQRVIFCKTPKWSEARGRSLI